MDSLIDVDLATVLASLKRLRVTSIAREYNLQLIIANQFVKECIPHAREVKLGPGNVVDFMLPGGIVIEVKKGKPPSTPKVLAQVERYAAFPRVKSIIIVVEGKLNPISGTTENGKPVALVNLAKQWGVTL